MRLPVFFALLHFSSGPLWPAFCFGTGEICRPFWPLPSRRTRCCATGRWPGCRRGDPGVRDPSPLVLSNTPLRNVLARAARLAWYRTGEEGAWRPATEQQRPPSPPRCCSCCGGRRFGSASVLVVGGCCCTPAPVVISVAFRFCRRPGRFPRAAPACPAPTPRPAALLFAASTPTPPERGSLAAQRCPSLMPLRV